MVFPSSGASSFKRLASQNAKFITKEKDAISFGLSDEGLSLLENMFASSGFWVGSVGRVESYIELLSLCTAPICRDVFELSLATLCRVILTTQRPSLLAAPVSDGLELRVNDHFGKKIQVLRVNHRQVSDQDDWMITLPSSFPVLEKNLRLSGWVPEETKGRDMGTHNIQYIYIC